MPDVRVTTTVPSASVEVEGVAGVGSSTFGPHPPMTTGRGRGRGTFSASTPRTPMMPTLPETLDWDSPEIRRAFESMWLPEAQRSGSLPPPNYDWTQHISLTPFLQTPRATTMESPSVNTRPWSLSPPTSAAARGINIRDVSDFENMLRSEMA